MERKSARTSLSLFLSTLLHASVLALIALGPAFIPGLEGKGDRDSSALEFSVHEMTPVEVTAETQVATPVTEQPVVVQKPVEEKPVIKPVAKKTVTPKPKPTKQELPEKIEEQPAVAYDDQTESTSTVEESPVAVAVAVAEEPTESGVAPEQEEVKSSEITEEEVAAAPVVPPLPPENPAPAVEQNPSTQAGSGEDASLGAGNVPAKTIEVTQTYLGLQQVPGNVPPSYTREMRLKKLEGRGQLVYFVTKDGTVSQMQLTRSTGSPALDQAAMNAFKKYKFVAGQEGYTVHDFEFSLKGPAQNDSGRLRTTMNR